MDARQARSVWTVRVFSTALRRQGLQRNDVNAAADFRLQSYAATGRRGKVWDNDADDVFNQLFAMAKDPQIQRELRSINAEFSSAESDGLGKI